MRAVTAGEALGLLRGSGIGGLDALDAASVSIGGAEFNVAVALARLGVETTWLGRVGDDPFGRRIVRELRSERVTPVAVLDPGRTALMLKEQLPLARTRVTFYRADSAGSRLGAGDVDLLDLDGVDLVHVTGIGLGLSPRSGAAIRHLVERARAAGAVVSFDVNHRQSVWEGRDPTADYREIAAAADIVFGGRDELELLVGQQPDRELAEAVVALGPAEVVVKRGSDGAATLRDGTWTERPARVVEVVDTVGAGDLFVAGYLFGALEGRPVSERLAGAVLNGAAACTHPGDWEGALHDLALASSAEPVLR